MLKQPTREALLALTTLTRQPRWRDVEAMIEAEISAWTETLLNAGDPRQIGEAQGRIKAYRDLQAVVRDAPAAVEKLGLTTPL